MRAEGQIEIATILRFSPRCPHPLPFSQRERGGMLPLSLWERGDAATESARHFQTYGGERVPWNGDSFIPSAPMDGAKGVVRWTFSTRIYKD